MEKLKNQKQSIIELFDQKEMDFIVKKSLVQLKTLNVLVENINVLDIKISFVIVVE